MDEGVKGGRIQFIDLTLEKYNYFKENNLIDESYLYFIRDAATDNQGNLIAQLMKGNQSVGFLVDDLITDKTLSVEGRAADAKAVGNYLKECVSVTDTFIIDGGNSEKN